MTYNRKDIEGNTAVMDNHEIRILVRGTLFGELFLLILALLEYFWLRDRAGFPLLWTGAAMLVVFGAGCCMIERRVHKTMYRVNETIRSLIDQKPIQNFSMEEDSLLGKFQSQIFQLHDILRSYEEREKSQRKQLSESVSDLVHQMNTPITNIRMYGEFLDEEGIEEERRRECIRNINLQIQKLSWLGQGFSKISRLETGLIALKLQEQPLLPIVLRAVDQAALKAEQKRIEIALQGKQDCNVLCDRKWTEEAIFNVLDNAVKYSDPGGRIVVEIEQYELYKKITVSNQGIRLSEREYPLIFQRFYRGDGAADCEGVGLGLYLTREIITRQNGYMKVSSGPEGETRFSIFLI